MTTAPRTLDEIDTPAAIIDLDLVRQNIRSLQTYLDGSTVHMRPHSKTHKTPQIALMQINAGAHGVTCAKVGEAEAMVAGGVNDILIANQIIGATKISRLCTLARRAKITVAVDDERNVHELSQAATAYGVTLGVVIEIDVGMQRCGIAAGAPALALAKTIDTATSLELIGLMGYEGHTVSILDHSEREAATRKALAPVIETKSQCEADGIQIHEVTGGATNTFDITSQIEGWTELQCGSFATMDAQFRPHAGNVFAQAFWILACVVSRPSTNRAVLDTGLKSVAVEPGGLPIVEDPVGIELTGLAEEHGRLTLHSNAPDLKIGQKLKVTPWHGCTTFNLHDTLYVVQDDEVVDIWPIAARGRST